MFHAKFLGFLIFPIGIALCFIRYLLKEDESRHLDVVMNINKERKINTNKNYDIINVNNLNSKFTKARGYYKCKTILVSVLKGHDFRCVCAHLEPRKKLEEVYSLITDERGINVIEKHYLEQEIKFLTNVSFDSSFVRSGTVLFILSDLAELPRNFERELYKMKVPLLSHSHSAFRGRSKQSLENSYVIFQPDFHFIKSNGFRDIITAMSLYSSSDHLPYHKRSPVVFWRGATTGGNIADDTIDNNNRSSCGEDFNCKCSNLKRVHLCRISRGAPWLDVKIYKAVHVCRGRRGLLNTMGILAPKVREIEWAKNRGILDIDGSSNAYGLLWRLASGSVVFRVESKYTNAYIRRLRPWRHYIPIRSDLSDLINVTRLVKVRNFKYIRENARLLVSEFTYDREVNRVAKELSEFWRGTGKS